MRWFVILGIVTIPAAPAVLGADLPRKVRPVVVWTGTDSKQSKESFARCTSPKEWQATWKAHTDRLGGADEPACPQVDFDSYTVIAIFRKRSRLRISEVVEEQDCVRVRYQPWGDQIAFIPGPKGSSVKVLESGRGEIDLNKPYLLSFAFIVLPKGAKAIILEEDVQSVIGDPPVWKECAKFPATVEK